MVQTLEYGRAESRTQVLRIGANLCLVFPLFVLGMSYGQWLFCWYLLGRPPIPSADDPKDLLGKHWGNSFPVVLVLGTLPTALGAIWFNLFYAILCPVESRDLVFRVGALVILWLILIGVLYFDPYRVNEWWAD